MQKVILISIFAIICQTALTVGYERAWNLRQKRTTNSDECQYIMPSMDKRLPNCCEMPNILPGLDDEFVKCFDKLKQLKPGTKEYDEMVHGKDAHPCVFQCIFTLSGLASSDGQLNEDAIIKKMSEGMNNDEIWKSLWQESLNKCLIEVKSDKVKSIPKMNSPSGKLMNCLLRDMFMKCPKDKWVESSECTKIKDLVQKCPEIPPPIFRPPPKVI